MAVFNDVDTFNELRDALNNANTNGQADTINLTSNIILTDNLPLVEEDVALTINGGGSQASGSNNYRPFFVKSGTVVFDNLSFTSGKAQGGNGGGGGAGMGGALFIYGGNVTVRNASFSNNQAVGGNSGFGRSGGGIGGFSNPITGNPGAPGTDGGGGAPGTDGGGGGDGGFGGDGGTGGTGGNGSISGYDGNGGTGGMGGTGGFGGGGGGGGFGGYGGRGGTGGNGGFGGGGGFGGSNGNGFGFGFGTGGNGGFGGGGGGGGGRGSGARGVSGFGGGTGSYGGGGAGMGGAIFIRSGSLNLNSVAFNNNSATGGKSFTTDDSQGLGGAIFVLDRTANSNGNNQDMPTALPTVTASNITFSGNNAANATGSTGANGVGTNQNNVDVFGTIALGTPANARPTDINLNNNSVPENQPSGTLVGSFTTTDPDVGDSFTYSLVSGTGSTDNTAFSITTDGKLFINSSPDYEIKSNYSIRVRTTDGDGLFYEAPLSIAVNDGNDAPTLANEIASQTATEDSRFSFQLAANTFRDVDAGDTLNYAATLSDDLALPTWLSFNSSTRTFSGTPTNSDVGNINIKLTATDSGNATAATSFNLAVANTNDAPKIANPIATQTASAYTPLNFQFAANTFSDVDAGDSLSYSATLSDGSALPTWLNFDAHSRTFNGSPTNEEVGSLNIKVTASDTSNSFISNTFALNIALPQNTSTLPPINGTTADNKLNGGAANDLIDGGAGNDTLKGNGGDDNLNGGDSNDLLRGGIGKDILNGGNGNDRLYGDAGNDILIGSSGVDILTGGVGHDILDGSADNDRLYGDAGNDTLFGGSGTDILRGGDGDDNLTGGAGNDSLYGNAGNDTLTAGFGYDMIWGGAGNDKFVLTAGQGYGTIRDFTHGQDLLSLGGGLKFAQLTISQCGIGTSIVLADTGSVLARLSGLQTSPVTAADFV